jgi:hypothetical protein
MHVYIHTLSSVIENIRIIWVVFNSVVKALECLFGITLFHVYACQLDQTLGKPRKERDGFNEVVLGSVHVASQEPNRR